MNIFAELRHQIEAFKDVRDHVVGATSLPSTLGVTNCGEPPFAMDDGTNFYAVIDEEGEVRPLPFGYQIDDDDLEMNGVDFVLSRPMSMVGSDISSVRYVPLVKDFDIPGERAFCLESAEDSNAWETLGKMVDTVQHMVNEQALIKFNHRLSNAICRIYEGIDEFDSVDQAIAGLFLQSSTLPMLFLGCYRDALDAIEEELNDE